VETGATFHATGRVTSIAVDPTGGACGGAACRIFVGTAGGGLWMTSDGGDTFTNISGILDPNPVYIGSYPQTAVGSVALNTATSPPTILLATGEGNVGDSFWGDGIFSSGNLGQAWSHIAGSVNFNGQVLTAAEGEGFTKIAVDSTHSPPYVYAAATYTTGVNRAGLQGLNYGGPNFLGIWQSTDGGSTFAQYSVVKMGGCFAQGISGNTSIPCAGDDVVIDPLTNYVYAAVHDWFANSGSYAVMRSTDSGNTWTPLALPAIQERRGSRSPACTSMLG